MQTPIMALASSNVGPINSATRHNSLVGGDLVSGWVTSASLAQIPMPIAGSFSNLQVRYPTAVGGGKTNDISLAVNGSASALTCQITNAAITASDTTHSVAVVAGDLVSIQNVPAFTPTGQTYHQISLAFDATVLGKSALFSRHPASTQTTTFYIALGSNCPDTNTSEAVAEVVMPCDGTLDVIYGRLSAVPGAGTTRTYTVRKNGTDTGLTLVFGAADQALNVTSSVSFVAGDRLAISCVMTGAPASANLGIGIGWTPAVIGESIICTRGAALSAAATRYLNARGAVGTGLTTESDAYNLAPVDFTARSLYARLSAAPNTGKSRALTARKGAADQALTVTLSNAATTGNDTTHSFSVTTGDLLDVSSVPSGTPDAIASMQVSMVAFIAPPSTGGSQNLLLRGVG